MIIGIIHPGSGLGDSLFSYIATRVRAADLGVDFGFVGKEYFKGASFMNLDWGVQANISYTVDNNSGAVKPIYGGNEYKEYVLNKPYYNPEINFIPDGSVIDGYGAQDIRYFEHRLDEVREWLKLKPEVWQKYRPDQVPDYNCVINFRGGEYIGVPELFLPQEYWDKAIEIITGKYKMMNFSVHTDDPETAKKFFPSYNPIKDIEANWVNIRYSQHLIISNSAFAILPALLNENVKEVIAPKFWAGRNVGEWRRPQNYYKKFTYI